MKTTIITKSLLLIIFISCFSFSCKKHSPVSMNVGFFRGPDMNAIAMYLYVDGVNKGMLTGGDIAANCNTKGIIRLTLGEGTHSIGINFNGTMNTTYLTISADGTVTHDNYWKYSQNGNCIIIGWA